MNESNEKAFTTQPEETYKPSFAENWCQTLSEATTTDFEWNIPFPFLEYPPPSMTSSRFSSGDYCSWTLLLGGSDDEIEMELELERGTKYSEIASPIQVTIGVANEKGNLFPTVTIVFKKTFSYVDRQELHAVYGFSKKKLRESKFYEKEGSVTVFGSVKIWTLKGTKSGTSKIAPAVCPNQLLLTQFEDFFENKTLSDVSLNVRGRTFHAHKIILAAKSKVFAAMFEHKTVERLTNKVDIQDVDPDVFHEVLRYLYTGRMSSGTLDKMAVDVLAVADRYMLDQLRSECETHLMNSISADNCVKLLALAVQPHPAMHLKKFAVDFLRRFPFLVMATDGWKKAKEEKLVWSCELIEMLFGV